MVRKASELNFGRDFVPGTLDLIREQVAHEVRLSQLEGEQMKLVRDLGHVEETANLALHTATATQDTVYNRTGWVSAMGYANTLGLSLSQGQLASLGRAMTRRCKDRGIKPQTISDARFGRVNIYPEDVLKEMEPQFRAARYA